MKYLLLFCLCSCNMFSCKHTTSDGREYKLKEHCVISHTEYQWVYHGKSRYWEEVEICDSVHDDSIFYYKVCPNKK